MRNKVKIFSIILTNHGKQIQTICSEATEKKIYKRFKKLLEESSNVAFPKLQNNSRKKVIDKSEYELVIIKCKQEGDDDVNKIRDDSGEFINYKTNDKDWIVVDRAPYNVAETFWVYGFHPRLQRKTFEWVFDNFVAKDKRNKYAFKTIQVYLNKLLIECNDKLEMVICKNKQDSIRLYNTLEEWCKKKKIKYAAFMGDIHRSQYKQYWIDKIGELTNWSYIKIHRTSTRP